MKKTYSTLSPPPRVVVKKTNEGTVVPDQALTVTDILTRFKKTGNLGDIKQNSPQYPNQEGLSHESPDFLKLSNSDKLEQADLLKETKKAIEKQKKFEAKKAAAIEKIEAEKAAQVAASIVVP